VIERPSSVSAVVSRLCFLDGPAAGRAPLDKVDAEDVDEGVDVNKCKFLFGAGFLPSVGAGLKLVTRAVDGLV